METIKEKIIREPKYDFRPTGFPDLDAINGLIKLADKYAKEGNIEKYKELSNEVEKALNERYNAVMDTLNKRKNEKSIINTDKNSRKDG